MRKEPRAGDVALHGSRFVRKWMYKGFWAFHMEIMLLFIDIVLQRVSKSDLKIGQHFK